MHAKKETTCNNCGRVLSYKARKPELCPICKAKQAKPYRKRSTKKTTPHSSKREALVHRILNKLLPDATYIDNGYYSWLPSPRGYPMQLDRYYPDLALAIEVQGRQHFEYTPRFHSSLKAFEYLQECDKLKAEHCKEHKIILIYIPHNKVVNKEYITQLLNNINIPLSNPT